MKISIEQAMHQHYIKYDKMVEMVNAAFVGSTSTSVNIFIDVYSLVKGLYKKPNLVIDDYSSITSSIINLCSHMRHFFISRYNVSTKIYIVASRNCCDMNKALLEDYNVNMQSTMESNTVICNVIKNNIALLEILCPYLHDIFFISGEYESGVYMYDIICKNEMTGNTNPNIILTRDPYNFQLVPMRPYNIIFRPKKHGGEDLSYYLDNSNLIEQFSLIDRLTVLKDQTTINAGLFTVLLALSRVPERSIKSLFNMTKAIKILEDAVSSFRLLNGYNSDMENVWNSIYSENNFKGIGYPIFRDRFDAIDIQSQHYTFSNTPESKKITFQNLYDPETIKLINNEYFKNNPLDLNRL